MGLIYTRLVRLNWKLVQLAMLAAFALTVGGCSGINSSQSVSPLDFFLPGFGHMIKVAPASTNAPVALSEISTEVALTK